MLKAVRWYGKGAVITDRGRLEDAPAFYKKFRDREDGCIKVVLNP